MFARALFVVIELLLLLLLVQVKKLGLSKPPNKVLANRKRLREPNWLGKLS